ncbi:MAG: hypothetical protein H6Q73_191 [Firmicutes bacterium]|nr:hypothetical protein [Bacillota bacterium]
MCFSTSVSSDSSDYSAAPTSVSTGDSETLQEEQEKQRKKLREANGYAKNIVAGTSSLSSSNVSKKSLLGE